METTRIRKVKRPSGASGLWSAYVLYEDAYGVWLFSPQGTLFRAEQDGRVVGICEVGQGDRRSGVDVLHLVPRQGWWFAHIYDVNRSELFRWPGTTEPQDPRSRAVAIDVCRPAQYSAGTWTYVDLEIDLLADGFGTVVIEDEDEFEERRGSGVISVSEASEARDATVRVAECLKRCDEPFGHLAWRRMDAALGLNLLPIRELPPLSSPAI